MTRFASLRFPLIAGLLFAACSAPQARIMDDNEEDLVGGNKAGSAVFDRIVNGSVKELLNKYTDKVLAGKAATGIKVAFGGVENRQNEELGEWRDELNQLIDTSINEFEGFSTVSQRYVAAGLRGANIKVDELFEPAKRRQFLTALEQSGNPVKAIVFATITAGAQEQGQTRQRRYRLTLEMIDTETGENLKADADVRKEYNR